MRIVSWNVGANTGYDWEACRRYLDEKLHAHVALLQQVPLANDEFVVTTRRAKNRWGSAIRSSVDMNPVEVAMPDELRSWLRIAAAVLPTSEGELFFASVHPHFDDAEWARAVLGGIGKYKLAKARYLWHCDLAYGVLRERLPSDASFVIGGDWNTARAFEHSVVPDAAASVAFFDRALDESGWHDVLYEANGEQEVPTYVKRGSAYQLDHVFCDARTQHKVEHIRVDASVIDRALSDHVPIIVDLTI